MRYCDRFFAIAIILFFSFAARSATQFPVSQNWLGGDVAASIPLNERQLIWIFGDSFVDGKPDLKRSSYQFINNSVAVMTFSKGSANFKMKYSFARGPDGKAQSLFRLPNHHAKRFFWPKAGFLLNQKLYVSLLDVEITGTQAFEFHMHGVYLAQVVNPYESPEKWKIVYARFSDSNSELWPGTSFEVKDGFVYSFSSARDFSVHKSDSDRMILLHRYSIRNIEKLNLVGQLLTKGNHWKRDAQLSDAQPLFHNAADEMSIVNINSKWIATYSTAWDTHVRYRSSDKITGPWTDAAQLTPYPDLAVKEYVGQILYYAGKMHRTPLGTMITYVSNTIESKHVLTDNRIYVPYYILKSE